MPFAGNQPLPNDHRRKHWTRRIKTCFDQPMKKIRRRRLRAEKKSKNPLQPTASLHPVVRCPTRRYNFRVRKGRGFSLQELKAVGLHKYYAPTVGITVDYRRKNKSVEGLTANVNRLKEYLSMVVVSNKSKNVNIKALHAQGKINTNVAKDIIPIKQSPYEPPRVITEAESKFDAYKALRRDFSFKHRKKKPERPGN